MDSIESERIAVEHVAHFLGLTRYIYVCIYAYTDIAIDVDIDTDTEGMER